MKSKSSRNESGGALLIAIASAIPLLIAGGTLLVTATQRTKATEVTVALTTTRDVSASGAQDALAQLGTNPMFRGSYPLTTGGALAQVSVADWSGDGIDNDGNGLTDDPAEDPFVEIVSSGTINVAFDAFGVELRRSTRHARSITEAIVQKSDLDLVVSQAAYVDDPLATFHFDGLQFLFNGNDLNLDGTAGPNAAIPGIGTPGDPSGIASQLLAGQQPLVQGLGGTPSVQSVTDVDLAATVAAIEGMATQTWNGPIDTFSGAIGDRVNMVPVVAHSKGSLTLDGDVTGCGILVVDGDLTIDRGFDFAGLIYVTGALHITSGAGDKKVFGGLLALGEITGPDPTFADNVLIQYSSQALTTVAAQLEGAVTLVSWAQR